MRQMYVSICLLPHHLCRTRCITCISKYAEYRGAAARHHRTGRPCRTQARTIVADDGMCRLRYGLEHVCCHTQARRRISCTERTQECRTIRMLRRRIRIIGPVRPRG